MSQSNLCFNIFDNFVFLYSDNYVNKSKPYYKNLR